MKEDEFLRLLDRYVKGECTPEEKQYFDTFFNAAQKDKDWTAWDDSQRERVKSEIRQSLDKAIDKDERRISMLPLVFRIAASVALLIAAGAVTYLLFIQRQQVNFMTETTGSGQRTTVTLSDGSVVRLNAGSQLTFPQNFSGDRREVTLRGEAFFDVTKDPAKPFIIHTPTLTTAVLGTSFNIRAYDNEDKAEVTVKTGRVKVSHAAGRDTSSIVLVPNEQAYFDSTTAMLEKRSVAYTEFLSWTSDILLLDHTPMREVMHTLERWYNVRISVQTEAIGDCPISGKYKNDRLLNILEGLRFAQGIDYRFIKDNEILITGTSCAGK